MLEKIAFSLSDQKRKFEYLLVYLIIAFIPSQFGPHFWPDFAIVQGLRIDYLSPTLYVTDILIVVLFIFWTSNVRQKHLVSFLKQKKRVGFGLLFLVLSLMNIAISQSVPSAIYGIARLAECVFFASYLMNFIRKGETIWYRVVLIFSIGVCLESAIALMQFAKQGSLGGLFYFLGERSFTSETPGIANASLGGTLVLRPYGTFPHPNVLAGYLLCGIGMLGVFLMTFQKHVMHKAKYSLPRIFFSMTIGIGYIALLVTMSRVAILLAIVFAAIAIGKTFVARRSTRMKFFQLSILILLICIVLLSPLLYRFSMLSFSEEAFVLRGALARDSLSMITYSPLYGVGAQNYLIARPEFAESANISHSQPVHNMYLYVASEFGLLIAVFCTLMLMELIRQLFYKKAKIGYQGETALLLLSAFMILGFFDHYLVTLQQGRLLFAVVLALSFAAVRRNNRRIKSPGVQAKT